MPTKATNIPPSLYMLLECAPVDATRILMVATLSVVQDYGRRCKDRGIEVTAPVLEGRGFAKLDKLALQYLWWNHTQTTPDEDYAVQLKHCQTLAEAFPRDELSPRLIDILKMRKVHIEVAGEPAPTKEAATPPVHGEYTRPKPTSTTGLVWVLADEITAKKGGELAGRAEVIAKCAEEGINASTASTQYSKWKKASSAEAAH